MQTWSSEKDFLVDYGVYRMNERQEDDEDCVICSIVSESPRPLDIKTLSEVTKLRSDETTDSPSMDARVWISFPEELIIPILARLPLRSFYRLRTVCKKWHSLTFDSRFLQMCNRAQSEAPVCIMHDGVEKGYSYNPMSHTWHRLSTSFFSLNCASRGFNLLAAAGGLVLLERSEHDHGRRLFVVNPLNRSERELPPMLESQNTASILFAGMAFSRDTDAYNILIVEEDVDEYAEEFSRAEVYNSRSKSWRSTGKLPTHLSSYYYEIASTVIYNDNLYCLVCFSGRKFYAIYRLDFQESKYDQHEHWHQLDISLPRDVLKFGNLFEHRGQLMFGGEFEHDVDTRIHLWQVDLVNGVLEEVLRLPRKIFSKSTGSCTISHFFSSGDYLWISDCSKEVVEPKTKINRYFCHIEHCMVLQNMIMCNISEETWWIVPAPPNLSCSVSAWYALGSVTDSQTRCLFLFEPRMHVTA